MMTGDHAFWIRTDLGDVAEADDLESARLAARTLLRDDDAGNRADIFKAGESRYSYEHYTREAMGLVLHTRQGRP